MRKDMLKAHLSGNAFIVAPGAMNNLLAFANDDTQAAAPVEQVADNSVTYETQGNVAIISIEGGMSKKSMSGMCMSVAAYPDMIKAIDRAEADASIDTVIYRVDTPGGAVAGADEVADRIFNSKKRTITMYENMGASGGIWIFSASDELYASEATMLGSIGVIVAYTEPDSDSKRVSIVSKNAENKDCSLNGDCKDKIQGMLDTYEAMFYSRVERNTGFNAEQIKTTFNSGDVIFATEAAEAGFIREVTTFASLMDKLVIMGATTASQGGKIATILNQGANMKFDRDNLDETEATFDALVANRDTLTGRNDSLKMELQTATTALEASEEGVKALEAKLDTVGADMRAETDTRVREAIESGVSADVAIAMLAAETPEAASKLAIDANPSVAAAHHEGGLEVASSWAGVVKKKGDK